jgi:hypothetical protein
MRVALKLSAVVLLGVFIQWALTRGAGAMDERAFECRVLIAMLRGMPADDAALVDEAAALIRRQYARHVARFGPPAEPPPLEVADL